MRKQKPLEHQLYGIHLCRVSVVITAACPQTVRPSRDLTVDRFYGTPIGLPEVQQYESKGEDHWQVRLHLLVVFLAMSKRYEPDATIDCNRRNSAVVAIRL